VAISAAAPIASSPPVTEPLRIFAAGSLRPAFDRLAAASAQPLAMSYANARDLAHRIAAGEPADVFAAPGVEHARRLRDSGLAGALRPFATNRLVVAVAQSSPARDVRVLAADGTRLVIEAAGIPLGDYTRTMLVRMNGVAGADFAERAMANVVLEEQLVDAVAARVLCDQADVGVLYATDVAARAPRLRAIEVPAGAEVAVTLAACVTTSAPDPDRAAAWVAELAAPATQAIMRGAGFGPAAAER
jgi:molybdate transport system substrate-binding protein